MNQTLADGIARRLREVRELRGLSQRRLGRELGYADGSLVCHYELGRGIMGVDKLMMFCNALGVSADYILGLEVSIKPKPSEVERLFDSLPLEKRAMFLQMMEAVK